MSTAKTFDLPSCQSHLSSQGSGSEQPENRCPGEAQKMAFAAAAHFVNPCISRLWNQTGFRPFIDISRERKPCLASLFAVALLLLTGFGASAVMADETAGPNVVLILADDLAW